LINFIDIILYYIIKIAADAYPADETAGMPLGGQGRHVVLHYGLAAPSALGREHVEVIVSTVRPAFALVESFLAELFAALSAEKVFGVPSLLQGCHAFLKMIGEKKSK